MKILWVVNIMLPQIAKELGMGYSNREGWLQGLFERVCESETEYEIAVAFPTMEAMPKDEILVKNIRCFPFYENMGTPEKYDENLENEIKRIIEKFGPDILHIFGTEFPHGLAASLAFNNKEKTLVGIQGLCQKIAEDYMALLPDSVKNKATFRDIIKKDSLLNQQTKFEKRGENEKKLIESSLNITGRTSFDKEETKRINPSSNYFKMNETMRKSFYEGKWNYENATAHSIFLGQGDYPIKGMHFLLEAAGLIVKKYPDIKIKIAGNSIINHKTIKDKLKTPQYGAYLRKLVKRNALEDKIIVLGSLTEEEMKKEYLSSAVYVCPSYIENSPNTVAEAMLLGMPVIASDAGGIRSVISDNEGYIFERGNIKELSLLIEKVFLLEENKEDELFIKCDRAYERAKTDYDKDTNYLRLLEIYQEIGKKA